MKSYSDCVALKTFEERFEYLKTSGTIGIETFGHDRYLNQLFYNTPEWKKARRDVIIRDNGCDLACPDRIIRGRIYIHHINPITADDVVNRRPNLFDPENLICVSNSTHNAVHYGDISNLSPTNPMERKPFDQAPWRITP